MSMLRVKQPGGNGGNCVLIDPSKVAAIEPVITFYDGRQKMVSRVVFESGFGYEVAPTPEQMARYLQAAKVDGGSTGTNAGFIDAGDVEGKPANPHPEHCHQTWMQDRAGE